MRQVILGGSGSRGEPAVGGCRGGGRAGLARGARRDPTPPAGAAFVVREVFAMRWLLCGESGSPGSRLWPPRFPRPPAVPPGRAAAGLCPEAESGEGGSDL